MLKSQVKAIVVACNTMSAVSLPSIMRASDGIPVIDVIKPTAEYVINQKDINNIGVIGTRATINSGAYQSEIFSLDKSKKVFVKSCPMFVPIVEEGLIHSKASEIIAQDYLNYFDDKNLDLLILGCTHYPVLKDVIKKSLCRRIKIIDSASPTAKNLKNLLTQNNLLNSENIKPEYKFYVTDNPTRSLEIANMIFEDKFPWKIKKVVI